MKLPPAPDQRRFELRCCTCGYGVVVRIAPDRCPMCGRTVWEHAAPRPLAALAA